MSYETFRSDVITNFREVLTPDVIPDAVNAVDRAAVDYDIERRPLALIALEDGIPLAVRDYLAAKAMQGLSRKTLKGYFYHLRSFVIGIPRQLDLLDANDIRVFLWNYKKKRNITDRSLEQMRISINTFLDWCVNEGMLNKNPCAKVPAIKYYVTPREPYDQYELEKVRFACLTPRDRAIVDLLYSTGMRVSELCNLKLNDINIHTREVKIMHGKGDKYRMTYMNARAVISLQNYLDTRTDSCPYVIVDARSKDKHGVQRGAIEDALKKIGRRSGVDMKKAKPHNMRHTFATIMMDNGAPVEHIQQLLGHAKISTTMIYARINSEDVRRTHERCAI